MQATILVVDDDTTLLRNLSRLLSSAGHKVQGAGCKARAIELVHSEQVDLAVLDWELPDGSGMDLLQELREHGVTCPMLMLTGRDGVDDRVLALRAGADDYIPKPFSPDELQARVAAHLRRASGSFSIHRLGRITIRERDREVLVDDRRVVLTGTEFRILLCLARNRGQVVARGLLTEFVWGAHPAAIAHGLNVHVANLRRKLGDAAEQIETVRTLGFRLRSA